MTTTGPWFPPRLDHLRRDRRGIPVPWINLWHPEQPGELNAMLDIRHDPNAGMDAVFMDDDGQPVPDFTRQNYQRQRASMFEGLCQVCGRPVPWSRRCLVYAPGVSVETITVNGEERVSIVEPWLDERCAITAVERCPALIRRKRDEKLVLVRVTSQQEVQFSVGTGWIEGPLEARTRANPVAMLIRVLLPRRLAPAT